MTVSILPPRHTVFTASVRLPRARSAQLSDLSYRHEFRPQEGGILQRRHTCVGELALTRSRKAPQRLAPGEAATLAAHVQAQLEHERARMARRLHGDVAGMLAAARMDLSLMVNRAGTDADWHEQVMRVDQILEAVIQNARSEMQRLHPALLDHFGLSAALRHLVEETARAAGAEYALELPEFPSTGVLGPAGLAAYRIVERLLEGRAVTRVSVRLREKNGALLLVTDLEGAASLPLAARNDLLALRAWLESLGGAWTEAHRGAVFNLELTLPRHDGVASPTTTS